VLYELPHFLAIAGCEITLLAILEKQGH